MLLLQETRTDGSENELKKWKKIFNTKQIFLTSFGTRAVGAGIIIRNDDTFKVLHSFNDPHGRYIGVIGDHEDGKFLLLSFYSPSVAREIRDFVINHIYNQLVNLGEDLPQFLILGGDTNTPFSHLDKQGGHPNLKNEAINAFDRLKQRFSLIDSYRVKNPDKIEFSWEVFNPQIIRERLDVIFVSNSLQDYITETGIIPPYKTCSDHGIPFLKIEGFDIPSRGPGNWKFNNQLLSNLGFVSELKEKIPQWLVEAEIDLPDNLAGQWGFTKHKIGEFSRDYGAKIKKAKRLLRLNLEKQIEILYPKLNDANKHQYLSLKEKLNDIIEAEIKGVVLRSLCDDYENGEKCSKYFFSLEKYRSKQKTISRIKLEDGSYTSNTKVILNECKMFYQRLYSKNENVRLNAHQEFFDNVTTPKLSEEEKQFCETDLTLNELYKNLKTFQKNKSPGLDGLTAELYITFWDELKSKLIKVYEDSFTRGILPETMRVGVVTLLEKKGKDRNELANWRPITLLNVDYKILTKTLSQRLKTVLPKLIHKDQNGFVPGGNIHFSAHTIRDILFYCKKENLELILLALDYTKAFDSLDFDFIHETFKVFNFGENFRKWIKVIFNGGKSCITNNGHISEKFYIKRSTRQGDPISPQIFILGLEILFIALRADGNIKGFKIENSEIKLTAFADDASYFLKDKKSAENLLVKIDQFSKISGLEVNKSKSECLLLSFEVELGERGSFLDIPVVDNLKVLGHFYGKSELICSYQNFYSKLEKMKKVLNVWKQRNLTLFGKSLLISSLSTSLFLYNAQIDIPPADFIKLVEASHKDFLWAGVPKIAHHTIIGNYKSGGIKYKDLHSLIAAINMKFIQTLPENKKRSPHQLLLNYWIKKMFQIPTVANHQPYFYEFFTDKLHIVNCLLKIPRKAKFTGHPFYYDTLKTYEKLSQEFSMDLENILSTPIWFNRILNSKFDQEISEAGFNYLKDLFPENQFVENFNGLRNIKIRKIRSFLGKVPQTWLQKIVHVPAKHMAVIPRQIVNLQGQSQFLECISSNKVYDLLIKEKFKPPTGLRHWFEEFNLVEADIVVGFTHASISSKSRFDQVFQYKIMTQILPTNQYLARYRIRDSDICNKCQVSTDTVLHRLWQCQLVVPFVVKIAEFLKQQCNLQENIECMQFIFGFKNNAALNQIIIELKKELFYNWDIYADLDIFLEIFVAKVRKIMIIEKNCIKSETNFKQYCNKWEKFIDIYDFRGPDPSIYSN